MRDRKPVVEWAAAVAIGVTVMVTLFAAIVLAMAYRYYEFS